jgi:hypothetical protein
MEAQRKMGTNDLTLRTIAIQAELTDIRNWMDDFSAAPPSLAGALGLHAGWHGARGDLAMTRSAIPFSHFNMVMNLGCPAIVDDAAFEAIEKLYAGNRHWVVVNDHCQPPDLEELLLARGYQRVGAWDRVILRGARPDLWAAHAAGVELVGVNNMADWSGFICQAYGLPPPIAMWLQNLVNRKSWTHAMLRGSDAKVVMARSLYQADDGWAWLGVDAPVPGVMAPSFAEDRRVIAALLMHAAKAGTHSFVSDIEAPSPTRRGPGYECWESLGFIPEYLRRLFSKG